MMVIAERIYLRTLPRSSQGGWRIRPHGRSGLLFASVSSREHGHGMRLRVEHPLVERDQFLAGEEEIQVFQSAQGKSV